MNTEHTAAAIADIARGSGIRIAVAESLTSGAIASALGAAPGAAEWFCGGVVAYGSDVKYDLLRVSPGPVVRARAAEEMARHVCELLGAQAGVAVTGAGGPEPQDERPPGTVFIAVLTPAGASVAEHHFGGGPEHVIEATVGHALLGLERALGS